MYTRLPVKYQFLSDINETGIFSTEFRKILKYQISLKSIQWELSCSMRTDGRTDWHMTMTTVAFRNFANAPNNSTFCPHSIFMCFVWIWEQTAIISLYNINWLVFITDTVLLLRGTDWVFKSTSHYFSHHHVLYNSCVTAGHIHYIMYIYSVSNDPPDFCTPNPLSLTRAHYR